MRTTLPKVKEIKRKWYEVDASQFPLGRLATRVAILLRGKHKAQFTPHLDVGDFVMVKNAKDLKVTGRKLKQKEYLRYSGYPGGIKQTTLAELLDRHPERVIEHAVRYMLPKNRLQKFWMKRLKILRDDKHHYKIDEIIND